MTTKEFRHVLTTQGVVARDMAAVPAGVCTIAAVRVILAHVSVAICAIHTNVALFGEREGKRKE